MSRIINLMEAAGEISLSADVCIIGAGAAGLYLGTELSRVGLDVLVLEAGGNSAVSGSEIDISPSFIGDAYRGAVDGRSFGIGGTTSRWGGLLVPYSEIDCRNGSGTPDAWTRIVQQVDSYSQIVLGRLGQPTGIDFGSIRPPGLGMVSCGLEESGIKMLGALYLPFQRRNLRFLLKHPSSKRVTVLSNAVACSWGVNLGGMNRPSVREVVALSSGTARATVRARQFVIAAGAIESPRILLEIDRHTGGRVIPRSCEIGMNLSDHLSCAISDVHRDDRQLASRLFGPWFRGGRLRSVRFTDRNPGLVNSRHFAHFIFDIDNSGFTLAKKVFASIQSRRLPDVTVKAALKGAGGVVALGFDKIVRSRLHIPDGTPCRLQLDVEQAASMNNFVRLGRRIDAFGRPKAEIQWGIGEADYRNIRTLSESIISKVSACGTSFPRLIPTISGASGSVKPHDAYHPVGTCRMGEDIASTVDCNLKVKGFRNLFVLSTAVFPSAGSANPTFSMLCLGQGLADRMASVLLRSMSSGGIEP